MSDAVAELDADIRRARRECSVGSEPRCFVCGERRPECLEGHHPAGRIRGVPRTQETVTLCQNCHACVSRRGADQRVPDNDLPDALFAEGLADILNERARWLRLRRLDVAPHG